jgi:hypothetical protein
LLLKEKGHRLELVALGGGVHLGLVEGEGQAFRTCVVEFSLLFSSLLFYIPTVPGVSS